VWREVIHWLIEAISECEMRDTGWKMVHRLIESGTEIKMGDIWWEAINTLVEIRSKAETIDTRRDLLYWLIEANLNYKLKVNEACGEVIYLLVEFFSKDQIRYTQGKVIHLLVEMVSKCKRTNS